MSNKQDFLFDEYQNENPKKAWKGMPEFDQKNMNPVRKLIVNFESQEDFDKFISLLKLEEYMTDKTKSIWFPIQEKEPPKNFGYMSFEERNKK